AIASRGESSMCRQETVATRSARPPAARGTTCSGGCEVQPISARIESESWMRMLASLYVRHGIAASGRRESHDRGIPVMARAAHHRRMGTTRLRHLLGGRADLQPPGALA